MMAGSCATESGVPITKPHVRHRGQAEVLANLTGSFVKVNVPVLWLGDFPTIKAIPLYGVATEDFWLQPDSRSANVERYVNREAECQSMVRYTIMPDYGGAYDWTNREDIIIWN